MAFPGLRCTKAALLVFGAGATLGLVVVSINLPAFARVASAAMALGIAALPFALVADRLRKARRRPPAPRRRRPAKARSRGNAPGRRRAPRRR
jgi:hypothetical protein